MSSIHREVSETPRISRLFVLGFWIVVGLPAAAYWVSEPRPADAPSAECSAAPAVGAAVGAAGDQRAASAGPSGAPCPPALAAKVAAVKQPTGSHGQ